MTTTKTLADFIGAHRITCGSTPTTSNPNIDPDGPPMDHWRCELQRAGRRWTVYFSVGKGHKGAPPTCADVLDCLASDSCGVDQSFEDWAADLGYDTDSRKAERTFRICQEQARKLKAILGPDAYQELLYETERL